MVLIRAGSITRSLNTDQQYLELEFSRASEAELLVHASASGGLVAPGFYLLFLVSTDRVPSRGCFVQLRR